MKHLKNSDVARMYGVSDKTIRNWIEATQQKRLSIDLCESKNKVFIADTVRNHALLDEIVNQGKKFRNGRAHQHLKPTKKFYELFSSKQIIDIANDLDKNCMLSMKYKYFGEGAAYWNNYLEELHATGKNNLITNTIECLDLDLNYLDGQTRSYSHINIINLCVGNSITLKGIVSHFRETKKLKKVITIDLSQDMLDISEKNIIPWVNEEITVEKHIKDLSCERFDEILNIDSFGDDGQETINLVFLVAGPIVNFHDPQDVLKIIHDSIGKNDLLITSLKRDTPETRSFFNFNLKNDKSLLNPHDNLLFKLLNIDSSFYELRQVFSKAEKIRYLEALTNRDLSIEFETGKFKKIVTIEKGQALPIWWSWHHTDKDILNRFELAGFGVERMIKSRDSQMIMLTAKIMPTPNFGALIED